MTVPLIGPDGKQYDLPDESKLPEAIKAGFRVEGEEGRTWTEAAKGLGTDVREGVVTAAEGVLRGMSAGLSDPLLKEVGYTGATPEAQEFNTSEMKRRREENPLIAGGSELVGMLKSPVNLVGKAVRGATATQTAIGRIGAGALAGAAEGSLYGAGNALSESALGNTELTAEKLVAGAGLGALLGGAGGGVGTALGEGLKVALPAVSRGALTLFPKMQDFADARWLKAAGGIQGDIQKIPEAERRAVADVLRRHADKLGGIDELAVGAEREAVASKVLRAAGLDDVAARLKPSLNRDEAMEVIADGLRINGERIGNALKAADEAGASVDYRNFIKRFAEFKAGLNPAEQDIIGPHISKAIDYLEQVATHPGGERGFKALNSLKATLQKDTNWMADGAAKYGLKRQLVGIFRDEIDAQLLPQMGVAKTADVVGDALAIPKTPGVAATLNVRAPGKLSAQAEEFLAAKRAYGALSDAEEALAKKSATGADAIVAAASRAGNAAADLEELARVSHADRLLKRGRDREFNRWISPSDYGAGIGAAVIAGGPMGALAGIPSAIAHKLLRTHGAGMAAKMSDAIAKSPQLRLAAVSFAQKVPTIAPNMGEYGPELLNAIAQSPQVGLAHHILNAEANPDYAAKAQQAGLLPETPEEAGHVAGKANALIAVAAALKETDDAIAKGIDKVFKASGRARGPEVTSSQDFGAKRMRRAEGGHQQRMKEVAELAANPEALLERVSKNMEAIGDYAPGMAAASSAVAHRAVTYLAAQIRKPVKAGPLAPEWHFPKTDLFLFSKKLETVEEPLSVLEHAAAGTLTKPQIEALQAVYPAIYGQMRDVALEKLTSNPKGVPYKARLMLSLLTGVDADGTMGAVAKNQQVFAAKSQEAPQPGSRSGQSKLTFAEDAATPTQRRELQRGDSA